MNRDPVVLYDVMRESATRLVGALLSSVSDSASEDELEAVDRLVGVVWDEARSIPVDDLDLIVAATARYKFRRDKILGK